MLSRDSAIHLARRRLKRVRTLFEVVKPIAGTGHAHRARPVKEAFKTPVRPSRCGRHAGGRKSGSPSGPSARRKTSLRCSRTGWKAHIEVLRGEPAPIPASLGLLRIAEAEAASLAEEWDATRLLRDRLTAIYRKGRKCYRNALDKHDADDETLHDWRKQVKHRLHIGQMVDGTGILQGPLLLKELDRLSEYLGEDHDFANLAIWICHDPVLGQRPRDLAA